MSPVAVRDEFQGADSMRQLQQRYFIRGMRSLGIVVTLLISGSVSARTDRGWLPSFEDAELVAAQQQIPLLVHFHAPWCGPCRQMDKDLFSSPVVQRALQNGLAAVKVDITKRPDLKKRFAAESIPRDIVVHPDGSVQTLSVGVVPQGSYLSILRRTAARGRTIAMMLMGDADSVESLPAGSGEHSNEEIIGLSGYCPVMLTGSKEWMPGKSNLAERYRGVLYYFSGQQQRLEFLKNPDRYAPRNLGCDPVVLFHEQRAVTGRIRFGAFFDDKLYLFRTAASRREFKLQPLRYTRIQHAVMSSELTGQRFR